MVGSPEGEGGLGWTGLDWDRMGWDGKGWDDEVEVLRISFGGYIYLIVLDFGH